MRVAIGVDAGVHDPKLHALQACEHVDGGAAGKEVLDHLLGDGARIGAHTAVRDAVVGGEHHCDRLRDRRRQRPLRGADLRREGLEPAERAQRLRERVETTIRRGENRRVGLRNCHQHAHLVRTRRAR